uniref:Uncharacterized protein n=1 Tax=Manihot esculenta TaxID=3983 RepID=A0A2C9VMV7_MANES
MSLQGLSLLAIVVGLNTIVGVLPPFSEVYCFLLCQL